MLECWNQKLEIHTEIEVVAARESVWSTRSFKSNNSSLLPLKRQSFWPEEDSPWISHTRNTPKLVGTSYMIIIMYLTLPIISCYILLLYYNTPIHPYVTPYNPIHHHTLLYITIYLYISPYITIHPYTLPFIPIHYHTPLYVTILLYTSPYTAIHQHTPLYIPIHSYTSPYTSIHSHWHFCTSPHIPTLSHHHTPPYIIIHPYTPPYTPIHSHTPL